MYVVTALFKFFPIEIKALGAQIKYVLGNRVVVTL